MLTSPPWDRLPCWVRLWENSSSLAGECDPVAGVPTARGCGAPAGPPSRSEGRGSRSADAARSGPGGRLGCPSRTWAPGHLRVIRTPQPLGGCMLATRCNGRRVSPRSLSLLCRGVQDSQGRRSAKQPCPGRAAPPPRTHPRRASATSRRTRSQRHPLLAPVTAGPSGHALLVSDRKQDKF